ncbi:ABC transporter ATP-binding protein [Pseudoalteromonas rhizosphaerae]|uniref:ABC transporter ATP-binding protein n=1 Tax=Pseudoalteromonas rhizosphaerae TaxID=2518973 RepID=UPI00384FBEA6
MKYSEHKQRLGLLFPFKYDVCIALTFMLITAAAQLMLPKIVNYYVDGNAPPSLFDIFHFLVLIAIIIFSIISAVRFYLFEKLGIKVITRLRLKLHKTLLIKTASYYDKNNIAELAGRIQSDTQTLKDVLTTSAALALRSAVVAIGCIIMMFTLSTMLSLILLFCIPIFIFATKMLSKKVEALSESEQNALAKTNKIAFDNLNCHTLIKLYNWFGSSQKRYSKTNSHYAFCAKKTASAIAIFQGFFNFLIFSSLILMLIIGSHLIQQKNLTIGELASYVLYLGMTFTSLNMLAGFWAEWMHSLGATRYLFDLLKSESDIEPQLPLKKVAFGDVYFENISFHYPGHATQLIFDKLNIHIKHGQTTIISGPSGNGKSTLAKLLLGYYLPTEGKIRIGNLYLTSQNINSYRNSIAYVEQDPILFSSSVLENLIPEVGLTPTKLQMEKVIAACKKANAHSFISQLPQGYNTKIGDRGGLLSGGQKQRIAIARAFLQEPELVILDEFTSALDKENQYSIEQAIKNLLIGKTVIIISHKHSQINGAENLIQL